MLHIRSPTTPQNTKGEGFSLTVEMTIRVSRDCLCLYLLFCAFFARIFDFVSFVPFVVIPLLFGYGLTRHAFPYFFL